MSIKRRIGGLRCAVHSLVCVGVFTGHKPLCFLVRYTFGIGVARRNDRCAVRSKKASPRFICI